MTKNVKTVAVKPDDEMIFVETLIQNEAVRVNLFKSPKGHRQVIIVNEWWSMVLKWDEKEVSQGEMMTQLRELLTKIQSR